ncbi:serine/threonine-protein kinase [Pseudoxanthomonas suwonensis]|uniref:serine/threonine-protein kinase n=1 Tax=Pseudoxanthomonas suwonensis TaxID=314722 RepID=UPI000464E96C|nr:serine/threonine-protein kinase [Pseudoxanthomonas suwonensis]
MVFAGGAMDGQERELWRRADALFDALLDLPEDQREARLAELTADEALRTRVRRLLAAHSRPTGPLDQPPPALQLPAAALVGQRLGRWRLQEEIGRGGMAVVYRATAEDGAEGQVAAVKVLTLGSVARHGRDRFLQEQQALLRLRHPYIAALYDAGVSADGTPWLAMQLVEGEPIDRWCTRRGLDAAARVRLMLQVCAALDYSHRNLVVHRDIKPSNVLVDADGHVRVLDFGIARTLDGEGLALTSTALQALTPEYAAPEQFAGAPPATAMDVYGVGALLYRLLAGVAPRQGMRGGEVTAPSRLLRQRAETDPVQRQLAAQLRGDLDTIALKALAERPEDRYASVAALSEDLRRWLDRLPIAAHPPSLRYRLRKFAARNRWPVAAAAAALLLLVAGAGGTVWQMRKAQTEAARANALAEESQAQLDYLDSLLEVLAPGTEESREIDRAQLLAEATLRARNELADRPRVLAAVELRLGLLAEAIGDYARAADLFDAALARRRELFGDDSAATADALAKSGYVRPHLNPPASEEGLRRMDAALPVLRRHAPGSGELVRTLSASISVLGELDRYPEVDARMQEAMALCDAPAAPEEECAAFWLNAGSYYERVSEPRRSAELLERALEVRRRRSGAEHADTLLVASRLGAVYAGMGELGRGLALLEEVVGSQRRIYIRPNRQSVTTLQLLARLVAASGDVERALVLNAEYLEQVQALFGDGHPTGALGHTERGSLLFAEARFAEAAEAFAEGLRRYRLAHGDAGAAIAEGNYADALREQGQAARALPLQHSSLQVMERLFGAENPRVAARLGNLARTQAALGQHAQALEHYARAIELYAKHAREQGGDPDNAAYVAAWRARSLLALGRRDEAEAELRRSVGQMQANPQANPRMLNEAFAFLVETACQVRAADCADLRLQAEARLQEDIPGIAKLRLRQALAVRG